MPRPTCIAYSKEVQVQRSVQEVQERKRESGNKKIKNNKKLELELKGRRRTELLGREDKNRACV
jgi:hypothetical protein